MTVNEGYSCPKHPREVTYLRCAACNTPICDKCAVLSPVGYKCRACGVGPRHARLAPSLLQVAAVTLIGLAAGALGGLVLGRIGFFGLWLAFLYGRFVGGIMLKASGEKSGTVMEVFSVLSILAGGLAPRAAGVTMGLRAASVRLLLASVNIYGLLILIIIAVAVVSRLRWSWSYRGM